MLFQILLAIRRPRRPAIPEAAAADEDDIEAWDADQDPEVVIDDEPIPLRKAS
jgi:hypothetical protein